MLGLSPMLSTDNDPEIMARQFLYQFTQTGKQAGKGYMESYAFNGGTKFFVGGSRDDYEEAVMGQGFNYDN